MNDDEFLKEIFTKACENSKNYLMITGVLTEMLFKDSPCNCIGCKMVKEKLKQSNCKIRYDTDSNI